MCIRDRLNREVIFNQVIAGFEPWTSSTEAWHLSHLSSPSYPVIPVIPKVPRPSTVGKCRNISCTSYLSKVYELYVLEQCRKYVALSENQKGVSSTHFLVNTWEGITSSLEDNRASVTMTAIDYSKAFNRLEHQSCLKALAALGLPKPVAHNVVQFSV